MKIAAILAAVLLLGYLAVRAWLVMLVLGAAHHWAHQVPAFGFWATFYLVLAALLATNVGQIGPRNKGGAK